MPDSRVTFSQITTWNTNNKLQTYQQTSTTLIPTSKMTRCDGGSRFFCSNGQDNKMLAAAAAVRLIVTVAHIYVWVLKIVIGFQLRVLRDIILTLWRSLIVQIIVIVLLVLNRDHENPIQ